MEALNIGAKFWLYGDDDWIPVTVTSIESKDVSFQSEYGKKYTVARASLDRNQLSPMHSTSIGHVEDMAKLGDLHEASILYNLSKRYQANLIYTYIGSIMVVVNPYKTIPDLYSEKHIKTYKNTYIGERPPHIYAIANEAYYSLWRKGGNQCVLISGESGAGKTESTKHILQYLSDMSKSVSDVTSDGVKVEEAILQSSPILEAFGNAKTIYNSNSSRFGKFIKLHFADKGNIEISFNLNCNNCPDLLEKNRVVRQNPQERNFHIFYAFLAGASSDQKSDMCLYQPNSYYYLQQSGCISDPTINDKGDFQNVINAMHTIGLDESVINDVLHVLAGILMIGNIDFISTGGAQIRDRSILENTANLLQLDSYQLNDSLTQKSMILRGEEILSPLTVQQAADSRDSAAMTLYSALFKYLLKMINKRIQGHADHLSIGVLDIFGFENFKVNRFEQFNINFANEKLQEYFNKHIFSLEQLEYNREGLQWVDIDWNDNGECLDLVERKLGILSLIDEESHFPKGTDKSLLTKLHDNHADNSFYVKPRVMNGRFGIRHYAGEVFYDVPGFLEKNRDTLRDDLLNTLKESRSDFVYDILEAFKVIGGEGGTRTKGRKRATVSSQFKESLFSLMTSLNAASPYFVRCIKPNNDKVEERFVPELVLNQLKYSGMLETVKIRKAGFPVRRTYQDFAQRYKAMFLKKVASPDPKENCMTVLKSLDNAGQFYRLGKTKATRFKITIAISREVFLKDQLEADLETEREKCLREVIKVLINRIWSYAVRKRFLHTKMAIILIQKIYKGHFYKKRYAKTRKAAIVIQKFERGRKARNLYHQLLEEKRIEEERRREEERRKEEERRREMERLEQEAKMKELEELKRKQEEEERIKREAEEAKRKLEEEERLAALAKVKELEEHRRMEEQETTRRLEEEKIRKAEEDIRLREEELERLRRAELERLEKEAEEAALAQMEELDAQLKLEDMREIDEDEDFEDDLVRMNEDMSVMDVPAIEGYLMMRGGLMSTWKKHWCVLKDDTLMWFRGKQKALKMGWLTKKGGGTGTLSRRNWKKRWFVLKDTVLTYHDTDQDGAKVLGTLDLRSCKSIIDSGQRENAFSIAMEERTYHVVAENQLDWNEWFSILNRVHRASDAELREMKDEAANIKNAVGTVDTAIIDSVNCDIAAKPDCFNIITANRVYSFMADSQTEAQDWVNAIEGSKERQQEEGATIAIEKGWLFRTGQGEGARSKRRWFVLTSNSLDFYKTQEKSSVKLGSVILNSLCTVVLPPLPDDPKAKENGQWDFIVNGRKRSYNLSSVSHSDAIRWVNAIQEVIDNKPAKETAFEKLIYEIMNANSESMIERIYRVNPILSYTKLPLKMPLLPLPYGYCQSQRAKGKSYGTFYEEAVRIFTSLQELENVGDPIAVTQGILQTCHDMKALRDEIYCQLVKQTTGIENADSVSNLRYMQVLVCMCCTFLPSRKYLRYLRFHIKRCRDKFPDSELSKFANFALDSLRRTRSREFPPSREEIITLLGRRELSATVFCYGGGTCKISVNSATTAGEVVRTLCKGLNVTTDNSVFALFEQCGTIEKNIEDRVILADILAKFERYRALGIREGKSKWRLFFRIFCFLHPDKIAPDSVEGSFLFEQTNENVVRGKYPLPETTLCKLAAFRLQWSDGDYQPGQWIPDKDIAQVYPVGKITKPILPAKHVLKQQKPMGSFKGSIRKVMSPLFSTNDTDQNENVEPKVNVEEEMSAVKSAICDNWKKLTAMSSEDAQIEYMQIVQGWSGFGSTMIDVTTKDPTLPPVLWLGVSFRNVSIYQRGDSRPLKSYSYEDILSFGAPMPSKYKIVVEGRDPIVFETDAVIEIAKLMKAYINEIVRNARRKSQILRQSLQMIEEPCGPPTSPK
eukprot:gene3678-4195_t